MYEEILEKMMALDQQKPFEVEIRDQIGKLNKEDGVYLGLMLDGAELSRRDVGDMIRGELVKDASIRACTFVESYLNALPLVRDCLALGNHVDGRFLQKFQSLLTGEEPGYRQANLTVTDFRHVPGRQTEVEGRVDALLREVYNSGENPVTNAAHLHCGLIAVYPFEAYSEVMAGVAMNYYLEEKGFFPVALGYSRSEYVETMKKCLREKDEAIFVWGLERAIYNKLEVMLQMLAGKGDEPQ